MILIVVDRRRVIHDIRGGAPFGPVLASAHFFEGIDMRKAQSRVCKGASVLLLSSPALQRTLLPAVLFSVCSAVVLGPTVHDQISA